MDQHFGALMKDNMTNIEGKDPIKIFKRKVTESGLLEESQLEEIEKNIKKEIEEAVSESKEAKYPVESDLLTDVYVKY